MMAKVRLSLSSIDQLKQYSCQFPQSTMSKSPSLSPMVLSSIKVSQQVLPVSPLPVSVQAVYGARLVHSRALQIYRLIRSLWTRTSYKAPSYLNQSHQHTIPTADL